VVLGMYSRLPNKQGGITMTNDERMNINLFNKIKAENTQLKAKLLDLQKSYGDMQSERDTAIYNLQEYVTENNNLKVNVSVLKTELQAVKELLREIEWEYVDCDMDHKKTYRCISCKSTWAKSFGINYKG
jgi:predicted nuclease with TOPRIM domain